MKAVTSSWDLGSILSRYFIARASTLDKGDAYLCLTLMSGRHSLSLTSLSTAPPYENIFWTYIPSGTNQSVEEFGLLEGSTCFFSRTVL